MSLSPNTLPYKLRINGGRLRGRSITFVSDQVRPTKATVRKTLFNWLRPVIAGRVCLDCFAGSGILAFEAMSEGAGRVVCLDSDPMVVDQLQQNALRLDVGGITARRHIFPDVFPVSVEFSDGFDLVFLDPPFGQIDLEGCLAWLVRQACMRRGCLVYTEHKKSLSVDGLKGFEVLKRSQTAGVGFCLLRYIGLDGVDGVDGVAI